MVGTLCALYGIFIMQDTRIRINTGGDYHAELFTQHPNDITNLTHPVFKMGKFRIRREDSDLGERYFLSDIRDKDESVNAVLIHHELDKETLRTFGIEPNYTCGRMEVYRFKQHTTRHPYIVIDIHRNGITITDTRHKGKHHVS